jgi:HAD superfamily hydrolase (TIGR01509 family)
MSTSAQPPRLEAVIFDVDGTLADTERDGHRPAFNEAFRRHRLGIEWTPREYGDLLHITGGRRRVAHYLHERGFPGADTIAEQVHRTKTTLFTGFVTRGQVTARPGVQELIHALSRAGVRIAVATTGRRDWVEPLVNRLVGAGMVDSMITGDVVKELKPHPEAYLRALESLGVSAQQALAVEDSSIGLRAARAANLATVVVTNHYTVEQDFDGAVEVRPGFDRPKPLTATRCMALHRSWWARGHE